MTEKLEYLEQLKNNVGEEMAESMSEEITKVMDEQRQIEQEYARLVQQRDQLKGITNKRRLEETKADIMVSFCFSVIITEHSANQLQFSLYIQIIKLDCCL